MKTMGVIIRSILLILSAYQLSLADSPENNLCIVNSEQASDQERLAAKEIRRYMYLRTGLLVPIKNILPSTGDVIEIGIDKSLEQQQYRLRTVTENGRNALRINGDTFQPKVFKKGMYTIEVDGKQLKGIEADKLNDPESIEVQL